MIVLDIQPQGEHLTFHGEPDPTAPSLTFDLVMSPGSPGPDPHIHARQVETFEVISGEMHARLGKKEERVIGPGETLVVPAGQVHSFHNPSESEPLVIRITVEPALNFQWFLTESARLAIAGGGRWKDAPLLEQVWILQQTRDEHEIPGLPRPVTSLLLASISGLAVLLGRHRRVAPRPVGPTAG